MEEEKKIEEKQKLKDKRIQENEKNILERIEESNSILEKYFKETD